MGELLELAPDMQDAFPGIQFRPFQTQKFPLSYAGRKGQVEERSIWGACGADQVLVNLSFGQDRALRSFGSGSLNGIGRIAPQDAFPNRRLRRKGAAVRRTIDSLIATWCIVERSFPWAARFRCLACDYKRLPEDFAG